MSTIDELNDAIAEANRKVEGHLEAQGAASAATANVSITLGTAVAGVLAILARAALPEGPSALALCVLVAAAGITASSLVLGVLAHSARVRTSRKAVEMWNASKQVPMNALREGEGDERATAIAVMGLRRQAFMTIAPLSIAYEASFDRMGKILVWQVGLLIAAVVLVLASVFVVYLGA